MAGRGLISIHLPFRDIGDLQGALDCYVILAAYDLKRHALPPLYASGVRYRREKCAVRDGNNFCIRRREDWPVPSIVYQAGWGDCEDLAAWRAAELRLKGEKAFAVPKQAGIGLIHIVVRRGNGQIEDPSKKLGMGKTA